MSADDLSQLSMLELFRLEAESQTRTLIQDLLALEREPHEPERLESCMRAAHSLKGAARIVGLEPGVAVTHAMEDCFVAAQRRELCLDKPEIDLLLGGVDLIMNIAKVTEAELAAWSGRNPPEVDAFVRALAGARAGVREPRLEPTPAGVVHARPDAAPAEPTLPELTPLEPVQPQPTLQPEPTLPEPASRVAVAHAQAPDGAERALRVTAQNFNRLLGLAAQLLIESRWLTPFAGSLLRLKRQQQECRKALEALERALPRAVLDEPAARALTNVRRRLTECDAALSERLLELDSYDRRSTALAHRLYDEALTCRMRPFSDGVLPFPRMVRDLAQTLDRRVRLEILGGSTPVDRDVLEKLEAPLTHLLRNAIDHGIETPEARRAKGKPVEGVIRLEARHLAGMLEISVSDDGPGIDPSEVRSVIVARGLSDPDTAAKLSEDELHAFLFLPGFTLRREVTEISGRGVGLDAVESAVKQLRGKLRVSSRQGQGAAFQLHLPLTLSVVRSLIAEVGGEPYAFPLAHIDRSLSIEPSSVQVLAGRQHVKIGDEHIGLVMAPQIFGTADVSTAGQRLSVIVFSHAGGSYGLVVDRFLGVRELAVQPLDARLGKIKDVAAGALLEDGSPVLIVDVEDLIRSIEKLTAAGQLSHLSRSEEAARAQRQKRVLVVDDSFTVRELERKLIDSGGYHVEVAVDGMDGWNALRAGAFDLVVTDIDMPRMDGIALLELIRKDSRLGKLPVMIVSYKDREEDRRRGLEAGADYYLPKGSFKSEGLLRAVVDLIGEARA
jgi:two-component system sensor histidine kinase and response regulator WspE